MNKIETLPTEIGHLTNVENINLCECGWWIVCDISILFTLDAHNITLFETTTSADNKITSIPSEIGLLINLTDADFCKFLFLLGQVCKFE